MADPLVQKNALEGERQIFHFLQRKSQMILSFDYILCAPFSAAISELRLFVFPRLITLIIIIFYGPRIM